MKEEIVKRAMRGNRAALTKLCQGIAKSVLFRVRRYLPGSADTEDVAQIVLIRMCERIHNLRDARAFGAWLNTIILNESRRYMKHEAGGSKILCLDDYLEEHSESMIEQDREVLPLDYMLAKEDSKALLEIIDALPNRQREVIVLHYYQDITITETADIMGITRQGASNYLKLAREKIKEALLERSEQEMLAGGRRGSVACGALAALPLGPLLTEALSLEATQVGALEMVWVQQALAQATPRSKGRQVQNVAVAALALVVLASAAVITGVLVGGATTTTAQIERQIVFGGSDETPEHINPEWVIVKETNGGSELVLLGWQITAEKSDTVLYSGESNVVEEPFVLLPNGTYLITFTLADSAGREYVSYGNFQVLKEAS